MSCAWAPARPTRSAATNGTPRPLPHAARPLGQEHPLESAQGPGEPDDQPARHAAGRPTSQPPALPRVPPARRTAPALPPPRPGARTRAARRLAGLGITVAAAAVHSARPHTTRAPRRDPRRHPPPPLQRPPGRPQQQDPPDQPPRLRLSLRRSADRPRVPLLRRHHDRPAAMTSPTTRHKRRTYRTPASASDALESTLGRDGQRTGERFAEEDWLRPERMRHAAE